MKKCPACSRTFTDQSIVFCIEDGTRLIEIITPSSDTRQNDPALLFKRQENSAAGAAILNDSQNPPRFRVSVIARLIAAVCFSIPALGGALSSILLINVFQALRRAENAGIAAVMGSMKEASFPVLVSLYLAVLCGIVVIVVLIVRMLVETKTASPPIWFFAIGGILCLIPAGVFWKAQSMVIEALSPGSSVSAGGIGAVAAEISEWLLLSVVAAPIVVVILIAASVIPISSKRKLMWSSLIGATAIQILLLAAAIGFPFLSSEPKRQNETVKLPENVKYVEFDIDIDRDESMILMLTSDNKIKQKSKVSEKAEKTENIITREELPEKLKNFSENVTPDKQIVYLKADINASFEHVLQVFDIIRKAGINQVGLVVVGEKTESDPYQTTSAKLEVKLPEQLEKTDEVLKPNPLTLIAALNSDGNLMLNNEVMGTLSDPRKLNNMLTQIFKERDSRGVFREGTNEVEKTVFLKVSSSSKYGDFIRLVEVVKGAGAEPIGIQIDDFNMYR